jgi:uncharacterized protein
MTRRHYSVSLHGVGLSLGSGDPTREISRRHLACLARLAERLCPAAISDHLCWCGVNGRFLNDLLPLPYTWEALEIGCDRADEAQEYLGRPLLVENVSSCLRCAGSEMEEGTSSPSWCSAPGAG